MSKYKNLILRSLAFYAHMSNAQGNPLEHIANLMSTNRNGCIGNGVDRRKIQFAKELINMIAMQDQSQVTVDKFSIKDIQDVKIYDNKDIFEYLLRNISQNINKKISNIIYNSDDIYSYQITNLLLFTVATNLICPTIRMNRKENFSIMPVQLSSLIMKSLKVSFITDFIPDLSQSYILKNNQYIKRLIFGGILSQIVNIIGNNNDNMMMSSYLINYYNSDDYGVPVGFYPVDNTELSFDSICTIPTKLTNRHQKFDDYFHPDTCDVNVVVTSGNSGKFHLPKTFMTIYIELLKDIVSVMEIFNQPDACENMCKLITKYMFVALLATEDLKPQSVQGPIAANKIALFIHGRFLQLMPEQWGIDISNNYSSNQFYCVGVGDFRYDNPLL